MIVMVYENKEHENVKTTKINFTTVVWGPVISLVKSNDGHRK
jgi:hypothetical protein